MNYTKIFIKGLGNLNHLESYYNRVLKKALIKNYTESEFFDGIKKIISQVEKKLDEHYFEELSNINKALEALEEGRFTYPDNGLTDAENYKKTKTNLLTVHRTQAEEFRKNTRMSLHLIFNDCYGYTGYLNREILEKTLKTLKIIRMTSIKNNAIEILKRTSLSSKLANSNFFRIDNFVMEYYEEFQKEIKTNKPIHLKPTNWEEHKETFYNQKIDTYKDKGYNTEEKKINSEIRKIESLPNENEKYILLKEHYRDFLNEKIKSKEGNPKRTKKQIEFEGFFINITAKQIKNIKEDFKDLEPKETAIFIDLLYNDFKVLDIIYGSRNGKSQKDFIKHITDNSNQSINKLFSKDTKKNYTYKGNEADKTTIKTQLETILK